MSFVLRLPREMHLCRSSSNVPRLRNATIPSRFAHFSEGAQSLCRPRETTSERPKDVRTPGVLTC